MWSVFFLFLSYLDRNFIKGELLDAEKESQEVFPALDGTTFCATMSPAGQNYLYRVADGAREVRSVVSPAGRLVDCAVIANQTRVRAFVHACRLGLREPGREPGSLPGRGRGLETPFARMDEAKAMCQEFTERSERAREDARGSSAPRDASLKRSKRGFTYPGTLWCGAGNMADHYNQLGEFAETDSCCRIHDHCPHVIHAFSSRYGHTNFKWHSICHCDCDDALKDCLRNVNDTASRVVGQAFFNVIGVPCFEFVYEEQCAERHWYGLCKRYEKLPVAVLKEAVAYDFGGIEVIDVLTMAPPKKTDSEQSGEQKKLESATQSTGEPSLGNVVTAAEDFIKVLATVSTSQSSNADPAKGETESSDKKKRKYPGKKKKSGKKRKGKGRKRKQKADAGVKVEEGAAASSSGSKVEDAIEKNNFINDRNDLSSRDTNRISDSEYELGRKEEASNEVMKDEPAMDKENADVSMTSPAAVKKQPLVQDANARSTVNTETVPLSSPTSTTAVIPQGTHTRELRKGRRKKSKTIPVHPLGDKSRIVNTTEHLSAASAPSMATTPAAQLEEQKSRSVPEKRPVVSAASSPFVIPKVKRNRSKERAEGAGRKKRRKVSMAAPIVAAAHENSSADDLKAIPLAGAPTVSTRGPAEPPQVPRGPDVYGGRTSTNIMAVNPSILKRKGQRSKEKGLRGRRSKVVLPLLYQNNSAHVLPVLPPPLTIGPLNLPPTSAVTGRNAEETQSEWRLFTTATTSPPVIRKRHRSTVRQQGKAGKKATPAALADRATSPNDTPMTFTIPHPPTTPPKGDEAEERSTAAASMSPMQLSVQRAKEQFSRKKRRKAATASARAQ